jgi:antitoxin component YwqK of YwqJK toxin-antitoxin module
MVPVHLFILSLFILQVTSLRGQHIAIASQKQASHFLFSLPSSIFAYPSKQSALEIEADGYIEGIREQKTIIKTTVKKKKLEGKWISYHPNGQMLDSGNFVKGIPDGIWKVWNQDGNLIHLRQYDADLFFRIREEIKTRHPKYQKYVLTSQYLNEGDKVLHFMTASYSFNNSYINKHTTLESLITYNSNFITNYHPPFISCLHNGMFITYDVKGNIIDSGYYRNGLKEDAWLHYTPITGSTEKGAYRKGKKYHTWKTYDTSGRLIQLSFYDEYGNLAWKKEK